MKIHYDSIADALYIGLTEHPVVTTRRVSPDLMVDIDEHDQPVGVEILRVRQMGIDPFTVVSSLLPPDKPVEHPDPAEVARRRAEIAQARKRRREAQG